MIEYKRKGRMAFCNNKKIYYTESFQSTVCVSIQNKLFYARNFCLLCVNLLNKISKKTFLTRAVVDGYLEMQSDELGCAISARQHCVEFPVEATWNTIQSG